MSKVVQTNPSKNGPVKYDLRQLEDGALECDCPAFRFDRVRPQSCVHVREYRKETRR